MSNTSRTAELILEAITAHGGSITGAELRTELQGVDLVDRRNAINKLRAEGRLTSTGATTTIRYHAEPTVDGSAKAELPIAYEHLASNPVRDQFDLAEQMAADRVAGRASEGSPTDTVWLTLPAIGSDEVRLMAGLDQLVDQLSRQAGLDAPALARATAWLASKHQGSQAC